MKQLQFDEIFTKLSTEKTLKLEEMKQSLVFIAPKHIRKNLAKFLFNKKFNVYPVSVNSVTYKQEIKIRTKTRRDVKYRTLKKFYFKLPENFKLEE